MRFKLHIITHDLRIRLGLAYPNSPGGTKDQKETFNVRKDKIPFAQYCGQAYASYPDDNAALRGNRRFGRFWLAGPGTAAQR